MLQISQTHVYQDVSVVHLQAFTLYEESIADSRQKITALQAIVGTLHRCYCFSTENRDALSQSVTSYAAKLLKRADQCRAVCAASHVSWQDDPTSTAAVPDRQPAVRDSQRVMAGLKRALKVVGAAKQQRAATARAKRSADHLPLYVEIANHYLYYFNKGVDTMSASVVQQLLELVSSELSQYGDDVDEDTRTFWEATKKHIDYQKAADANNSAGEGRPSYAGLAV